MNIYYVQKLAPSSSQTWVEVDSVNELPGYFLIETKGQKG